MVPRFSSAVFLPNSPHLTCDIPSYVAYYIIFLLEFYRVEFRLGLQYIRGILNLSLALRGWNHCKCYKSALHSITQVTTENTDQNCSQIIPWETLLDVSFLFDSNYQHRPLKYRLSLTRLLQTTMQKPKLFIHGTVVSKTSYFPSADKGWEPCWETFTKSNKNHMQYQGKRNPSWPQPQSLTALSTTAV